jgi:hypothetical protein
MAPTADKRLEKKRLEVVLLGREHVEPKESNVMWGNVLSPDVKTLEAEYGVKLDPVRRDAGLTVEEVEERHPGHACSRADPRHVAGVAHLPAPVGGCVVQTGESVSAIIVRRPLVSTRWWSRSASERSRVTAAVTV